MKSEASRWTRTRPTRVDSLLRQFHSYLSSHPVTHGLGPSRDVTMRGVDTGRWTLVTGQ